VATALIEDRDIEIVVTGIRPGEKIHEILVSQEEAWRTVKRGMYFAIKPMLTEMAKEEPHIPVLEKEYSSGDDVMSLQETRDLLNNHRLNVGRELEYDGELLR
jgi:UDP-glucose 4-epimerase